MSVRSHYSQSSYLGTRATSRGITPKMCQTCIYRLQAEVIGETPIKQPLQELTPIQQKRMERIEKSGYPSPKKVIKNGLETPAEKVVGLFQKFGNYVAKNQAAMKAAGETTLMEDLSDAGKKMFNQAGKLGEEERERIMKMTSGSQKKESDDEVIDFMIGNRGGKK